ncbi:MAG TPA: aldolase/citrate lyase family protein [Steroidobacteraceae bacterium]|nr:aldolase/citrate lyase family protein [Steroidobacteraceae bacterium]
MSPATAIPSFRERLRARELLVGTFIKTPVTHPVEILGAAGLDFVVIDQEHAPFDRVTVDALILAGQAAAVPVLVRVPGSEARDILPVLDCGAQGVLVPHVDSAARAQQVVAEARYGGGRRGFTNSSRAGRYGAAGFQQHVTASDAATAVLAMVEDVAALDVLPQIMAIPGLDAVFIGRGDLSIALGVDSPAAPAVVDATEKIAAAARQADKALCAHVDRADSPDVAWLRTLGVTAFIVSSDQGLMRRAALQTVAAFRAL